MTGICDCTCTCGCCRAHYEHANTTTPANPPAYTKEAKQPPVCTMNHSRRSEVVIGHVPGYPQKMYEISQLKLCPKCLEQKTKLRWFNEAPEHNHVCPNYLYELKRPTEIGDMNKEFGWWTRCKVRGLTRNLIDRVKFSEKADVYERNGSHRWTRKVLRHAEIREQLEELRESLCC